MEIFLLLLDDLDDVAGTLRMLWQPAAEFIAALALFAATGYWLIHLPWLALLVVGASSLLFFAAQVRRRSLQLAAENES